MSAAEKLKALDEPGRIEYVVNMTATEYRAWKARPQILAVVEAAEEFWGDEVKDGALLVANLGAALAVLDSALCDD